MTPVRREALPEDLPVVGQFVRQLWLAHEDDPQRLTLEMAVARASELMTRYRIHLWEQEDAVVAYAATQDNGDHVFIRHYVIADSLRGQGRGRTMFEEMVAECYPGTRLRLDASMKIPGPKAFWEALGFAARSYSMERAAA